LAQPVSNEIPTEPIHRLSVEQYRRMLDEGILGSGDRVELLEGWLVEKMTKKPSDRITTRRVRVALDAIVPADWYVDTQEPIATLDSEPEPDVAVIKGRTEDYSDENPPAERVGLVVEVADVSLLRDRELKARIYARAGIPSYWIVNLLERKIEILRAPSGPSDTPGYAEHSEHTDGETIPIVLDGVEVGRVAVRDFLP
jgi:Uma2 family endonuclease